MAMSMVLNYLIVSFRFKNNKNNLNLNEKHYDVFIGKIIIFLKFILV